MADSNAFLVKPKKTIDGTYKFFLSFDDEYDLDHQIYVPKKFIFGHFNKRGNSFKLSSRLVYVNSPKVLAEYQKYIDDGKLEVVQSLLIPESDLEKIVQQNKIHISAQEKISNIFAGSLEKYFI